VRFYHTALAAKIESAPASALAKSGCQGGIVEKAREGGGKACGIAGVEGESSVAEHFGEGAEV
jgi:hypothetical protein